MKSEYVFAGATSILLCSAGCAGPIGIPFGLGPGWDDAAVIALLCLVIVLAYRPIKKFLGQQSVTTNTMSPLEVLRLRYARGEITEEEFQRMRSNIVEASGTSSHVRS